MVEIFLNMNKSAQKLGKLSAKKRKANGHDKAYYSALAKKRWDKARENKCKLGHICTSGCQNDFDCPCLAEHDCQIPAEQLAEEY